jgi:hypothetical protein
MPRSPVSRHWIGLLALTAVLVSGCYTRFTHPRAQLFQSEPIEVDYRFSPIVRGWYDTHYGPHSSYYYAPWFSSGGSGHHHDPDRPPPMSHPLEPSEGGAFGRGGRGSGVLSNPPQVVPPMIAPSRSDTASGAHVKPGDAKPTDPPPASDRPAGQGVGGRGGRR